VVLIALPKVIYDFQAAVIRTQEEIKKGTKIIYEAAFQYNGVLAALDILVKDKDGWKAYEVKSSTSISEAYHLDATIQYYAITNSGIELKDISIVYINNEYEKNGPIDVNQLFTIESVKEAVLELLPWYSE
jgi:predicted RecB family nuclease